MSVVNPFQSVALSEAGAAVIVGSQLSSNVRALPQILQPESYIFITKISKRDFVKVQMATIRSSTPDLL